VALLHDDEETGGIRVLLALGTFILRALKACPSDGPDLAPDVLGLLSNFDRGTTRPVQDSLGSNGSLTTEADAALETLRTKAGGLPIRLIVGEGAQLPFSAGSSMSHRASSVSRGGLAWRFA
jgi:hypothetical protein